MSKTTTVKEPTKQKTKPKSVKCLGKDRNMNPCRCTALVESNSRFCKNHQYMETYTDEQLQTLTLCSGCKKAHYMENKKICEKCNDRGKTNRLEAKASTISCAVEKCNSKRSEQNKYCMLHQIHVWIDEVHATDHFPCTQYIRGCRNILPNDSTFKRCEDCRKAERDKDKKNRDAAKQQNQSLSLENSASKHCNTCRKKFQKDFFVGEKGQETSTCKHCRASDKKQNKKRDREHRREQGRKYDAKESRKRQQKEWKSSNWDKVVQAWKQYRVRQRGKNEKEFLEVNAKNAKLWRTNNPEAVQVQNERKTTKLECQYSVYIQSAKHRNMSFEMSVEDYKSIVEHPCYYCGVINEKRGFHGMDRKNNYLAYTKENVVACCPMCNYMKGSLHHDIFIRRSEHIMSFLKIVNGNQYPDCFQNIRYVDYSQYKYGAKTRNLEFSLDKEFFDELVQLHCYICGRKSNETHTNGIDRFDSNKGYDVENCRSCCRECNFMKSNFNYTTFIEKLQKIRITHMNTQTYPQQTGNYKCEARKLIPKIQ
jgi:hypothetical protein